MQLPIMPICTWFPGDYRTREQTLNDVDVSKAHLASGVKPCIETTGEATGIEIAVAAGPPRQSYDQNDGPLAMPCPGFRRYPPKIQ
jgi:hypothetical protein